MEKSAYRGIRQVIAIGDLHGNYAGFKTILRRCGLIGRHDAWIARDTHLVQMGDVLGRGGEPGKIFRLLRRLEQEAPESGSRVHLLLGNHEAMSMRGLLAYNTLQEFQDMADAGLLDAPDDKAARAAEAALPEKLRNRLTTLGCREFQVSLSPVGKIGAWLACHDSVVTINGCLFVHGGLTRQYGLQPLEDLNEQVRAELKAPISAEAGGGKILSRNGPQWNRDLPLRPSPEKRRELEEVLDFHDCTRMVVGHTVTSSIDASKVGCILPLYEGKLYCIDTGIGKAYGGNLSALRLSNNALSMVYP